MINYYGSVSRIRTKHAMYSYINTKNIRIHYVKHVKYMVHSYNLATTYVVSYKKFPPKLFYFHFIEIYMHE